VLSSDLPGVNPATYDRMVLYYCLLTKVDRSSAIVRYFPGRVVTVGKWLKLERRPRGIDPRAHLVLGWSDGAAPREGGGSAAVLKGRWRCRAWGRG
jgi:hypothetical protein